jgi:hypothetical protein
MYEKEWFGIEFDSFTKPDPRRLADASFYDRFYAQFYGKFFSYDDLPEDWRTRKREISELIFQRTDEKQHLLSIGCGNGYIEWLLDRTGRNVVAVEPSETATRFLKQCADIRIVNGYFPECLEGSGEGFDFAYMVATDYLFDDKQLALLLRSALELGIGSFLLVSVTVTDKTGFVRRVKDGVKTILGSSGLYHPGQLWGYSRSPLEFRLLFEKAGFAAADHGFLRPDTYFVLGSAGQRPA